MEHRNTNASVLTATLEDVQVRSGEQTGDGQMTISGIAAVFNLLSDDLGGFREKIAPGAFTEILSTDPDVHMDWDHNTLYTLGRTRSKTLELTEIERGLKVFNRTAPTSYAKDLKVLMERGDIDQMSFKFTIGEEEWHEDAEGMITSNILMVDGLYDVCVCAQGAYPQTNATLEHTRTKRLEQAIEGGRVIGRSNGPDPEEARERSVAAQRRRLALARAR
jgi:uncharacterized protein